MQNPPADWRLDSNQRIMIWGTKIPEKGEMHLGEPYLCYCFFFFFFLKSFPNSLYGVWRLSKECWLRTCGSLTDLRRQKLPVLLALNSKIRGSWRKRGGPSRSQFPFRAFCQFPNCKCADRVAEKPRRK